MVNQIARLKYNQAVQIKRLYISKQKKSNNLCCVCLKKLLFEINPSISDLSRQAVTAGLICFSANISLSLPSLWRANNWSCSILLSACLFYYFFSSSCACLFISLIRSFSYELPSSEPIIVLQIISAIPVEHERCR